MKKKYLLISLFFIFFQVINAQTYELQNSISFNNLNDGRNVPDGITWYQSSPLLYGIYTGRVSATHSAIVTKVNSSGQAVRVTSKFGQGPLATHHPRNIPTSYGSPNPTFVAPNGTTYQSRIYFRKN